MTEMPKSHDPQEAALESWKEIAAYLKRDVRTVKRWEKNEGLPVRRHLHQARASVYAYPSELEAWRARRRSAAEPADGWLDRRPVRATAFAAMLVLTLMLAGGGMVLSPTTSAAQESRGMVARQVWAQAYDVTGGVSPDGRFLSYAHWATGDLGVYEFETGEARPVTSDGAWGNPNRFAYQSAWSRDGKQVAFSWSDNGLAELRVVAPGDGSGPRTVYRNEELRYAQPFDWTPDNSAILVLLGHKDNTTRIALVRVADGEVRILKTLGWRVPSRMHLSPDGRHIVYDIPPDENSPQRDIYILAVDASRDAVLVKHPATDYAPLWTPDGSYILFGSDRMGTVGLWLQEVREGTAHGAPRLVQQDMNRLLPLGFSRSGAYFYARATLPYQNNGDVYVAALDREMTEVVAPPEKISLRFEGVNTLPAWSPDGKQLAYVSQRGPLPGGWGSRVLVIRNLETGAERVLQPPLSRFSNPLHNPPRWSPDGRALLIVGTDVRGRQGFYLLEVESGAVTNIFYSGDTRRERATWAPAGDRFYYLSGGPRTALVSRELKSGREQELYRGPVNNVAASPDGRQLAFSNAGGLFVMPAGGGEPRRLLQIEDKNRRIARDAGLAWTPDNRHIVFVVAADGPPPSASLWKVSVADGSRTPLILSGLEDRSDGFVSKIRHITLSPDGRRLAFSHGPVRSEVWVMENFLPALQAAN
jgi:Tol biopolymer transport system component